MPIEVTTIAATFETIVRQFPNLVFAAIAIYYLARQNTKALDIMAEQSAKQFQLIEKLCQNCTDEIRTLDR